MRAGSVAEYPIGLETTPLLGEDRVSYHRRLLEDSSRLFKDENDIEVLLSHQKDDATSSSLLTDLYPRAQLTFLRGPIDQTEADLINP